MTQSRPVYLKLRDQIAAAIIEGVYPEGEMLPSVRALASEQGANPLTVAKAYQQFQNDGLVEVQRGVGMYVVDNANVSRRVCFPTRTKAFAGLFCRRPSSWWCSVAAICAWAQSLSPRLQCVH